MALKIKPPTHRADALGVFISLHDPAWNEEVYRADMEIFLARALKQKQDTAEQGYRAKNPAATDEQIASVRGLCALSPEESHAAQGLHPVNRYARGVTRYQPNCDDWDAEGKPCTVRSRYLKEGATEFTIRRLESPAYYAADEITNTGERLKAFARSGLRAVASPDFNWTALDTDTRAPDHVIEALFNCDPALPLEIGQAVISMCRGLDDAETFR